MSAGRSSVEARSPWAQAWKYARAVRVGDLIEVGGTVAVDEHGRVVHPGDLERQTRTALRIVIDAVRQLGGDVGDVVRTRVFVRDIADWAAAGRAHAEVFAERPPASSCVGGLDFLDEAILVEIEATAVVGHDAQRP